MKKTTLTLGLMAIVVLALSACSSLASVFDEGNEQLDTGMEHLMEATRLGQAGDEAGATAAYKLAQAAFGQAVESFQEVLERDPEHVSAMTNLGATYYNLNQLDLAIAQYQRALELEPDDAGIRSNLAAAHVQAGEWALALEQYEAAIELDPQLAQAHFGLGVVALHRENRERAIEAFEAFQSLDDGSDPMATLGAEQYLMELRGQ
jgi:tetratricopeptide (TPR) repeat protein